MNLHTLAAQTPGLPCRTITADDDPWFSTDQTERQYAARLCHRCPLLLACMKDALARDEQHGVWGGVDFEARAAGCGTERGYQVHKRNGQPVCPGCQSAHDVAVEANRRRILAREHGGGGSVRGYWMHRRLGEEACPGCKGAVARQSALARERGRAQGLAGDGGPRSAPGGSGSATALRGSPAGVQPLPIAS